MKDLYFSHSDIRVYFGEDTYKRVYAFIQKRANTIKRYRRKNEHCEVLHFSMNDMLEVLDAPFPKHIRKTHVTILNETKQIIRDNLDDFKLFCKHLEINKRLNDEKN